MFGSILLDTLLYFFVCVGIIKLLGDIWEFFLEKKKALKDTYVVLTVKNQQDSVEGIIRSIVWQNLKGKNGGIIPQIVVVNLDSMDETGKILEKLSDSYDFIHVMDKAGYMEWIKKMVK